MSRMRVPMTTSTFCGRATASPVTVTRRLMSGMPVRRKCPIMDMVVTLNSMMPTSVWRLPRGTTRPVTLYTSTFSAPWGYMPGSARTSMLSSADVWARM